MTDINKALKFRFFRRVAVPVTAVLLSICNTAYADLIDDLDELDAPKAPAIQSPKSTPSISAPATAPISPGPAASPGSMGGPSSIPPTETQQGQQSPQPAKSRTSGSSGSDNREPVYFESMGLQGQRSQGLINLLDKVVVTQGDMRLEADKATVHFDQKTEEVSKVVALGNVKMFRTDPETKQKVRAESNEVLFSNLERKITLKGNAKLWRGGDLIRGKQIVYELDTGWIKADRVEGIVQPGDSEGGVKSAPRAAPARAASKTNDKPTDKPTDKPIDKPTIKPVPTKNTGKGG